MAHRRVCGARRYITTAENTLRRLLADPALSGPHRHLVLDEIEVLRLRNSAG